MLTAKFATTFWQKLIQKVNGIENFMNILVGRGEIRISSTGCTKKEKEKNVLIPIPLVSENWSQFLM